MRKLLLLTAVLVAPAWLIPAPAAIDPTAAAPPKAKQTPHLQAVHPQLPGEQVDGPFQQSGRLRPPCAAVGSDRRTVGHIGVDLVADAGDAVGARRQHGGVASLQRRAHRIGATVDDQPELQ